MAKRSTSSDAMAVVLIVIVAVIAAIATAIGAAWNFLVETKLIWLVPFIIAAAIALRWYLKKKSEEKRVEAINANRSNWGDEMCEWLIAKGVDINKKRVTEILNHLDEWGIDTVQSLIQEQIDIGMTDEMVRLAIGKPSNIDNEILTEKWEKFRWIYGVPRQAATYVWFKDGKVTKIKQ